MKILIIDDLGKEGQGKVYNIKIRLSRILKHDVTVATTSNEGLSILEKDNTFDLVFIDQEMRQTEKQGLELGKEISRNLEYSHIPLVMLTAKDTTEYAVPALTEYGFSYFISKGNFTGKNIDSALKHIETLPTVKNKRELRKKDKFIKGMYSEEELLTTELYLNIVECLYAIGNRKNIVDFHINNSVQQVVKLVL